MTRDHWTRCGSARFPMGGSQNRFSSSWKSSPHLRVSERASPVLLAVRLTLTITDYVKRNWDRLLLFDGAEAIASGPVQRPFQGWNGVGGTLGFGSPAPGLTSGRRFALSRGRMR